MTYCHGCHERTSHGVLVPLCDTCLSTMHLLRDNRYICRECQAPLKPPPPQLGGDFTCGWCHERTSDWSHVKWCRLTVEERERQDFERAKANAVLLARSLTPSSSNG